MRRVRGRLALGAALAALLLVAGIMVYAERRQDAREQDVAPPPMRPPPVLEHWPRWGVTHTQYSADNAPAPVADRARTLLGRVPMLQNQHVVGWGVGNPEPRPGIHDFRDLDRRLSFIGSAQGVPVITLCCAPDWMKGGQPGLTDWNRNPTVAPAREYFDDYAALAARIAGRYPHVRHFLVWNEFKGFWNTPANRWDAEGYTELYNTVYDALKAVNPDIQVGGPYVPIETRAAPAASELSGPWGTVDQRALDAISYWLAHKKGADFVVVDGASMTVDRGNVPDDFTALGKFGAITTWLRQKSGDLPVWWAEWYNEPAGSGWSEERRAAVQAVTMAEFAKSGVTTALYWNPQEGGDGWCPGCLWSTREGAELPMAGLLSEFTRWFPADVRLEEVTASDPRVRVLAQARRLVAVNTADAEVAATVDGQEMRLRPYEVRWSPRQAAEPT
jgi:hypothetical protein